jgi:hypothetical protein
MGNNILTTSVVELLDRRFRGVETSTDVVLDTRAFLDFLTRDDLLRPYVERIEASRVDRENVYSRHLRDLVKSARDIARLLRRRGAGEDDLQEVDLSFGQVGGAPLPVMNPRAAVDREGELLRFLAIAARNAGATRAEQRVAELTTVHEFELREWAYYCRTSAGEALRRLREDVLLINPPPTTRRPGPIDALALLDRSRRLRLQEVAFEQSDHARELNDAMRLEIIDDVRSRLRKVYEAVREAVGSTLTYEQLLARYRTRSRWYDRDRLYQLVVNPRTGQLRQHPEAPLTLDLARYLYDGGVTVWYRVKSGVHELDLADLRSSSPLVVEAKAYIGSHGTRQQLLGGYRQLHSYLEGLAVQHPVREGYLVTFRLGGPIYILPSQATVGGFALRSFLIDLAPASSSGSRQRAPEEITAEEIRSTVRPSNSSRLKRAGSKARPPNATKAQ